MTQVLRSARATPTVTKELIDWLEKIYPNDIVHLAYQEEREINMSIGQQQVIAKLKMEFALQNNIDNDDNEE